MNNTYVNIIECKHFMRFSAINDESGQDYEGGEPIGNDDVSRAKAIGRIMTSVALVLPAEQFTIRFL